MTLLRDALLLLVGLPASVVALTYGLGAWAGWLVR